MKKNQTTQVGTSKTKHFIGLTAILFAFWILMSGSFQMLHLAMGIGACLMASWMTLSLLHVPSEDGKKYFYAFDFPYFKYTFYWIYLTKEIAKASIDVAKVVLDPKLPINPKVVQFKLPFSNPLAHATLANSITVTPGTITMDVDEGVYTIHALTDGAADGLEDGHGEMMLRISRIFGEEDVVLAKTKEGQAT
ncbi:MAG: Na+/H+ antiporter subunit E [Peptococcales bacterium]|jgi:multicomponent Na+:H+ antiporter subunit E